MTTNDFDLETFVAYRRLLDMSAGIVDKAKFYETAKKFVEAYEREEHEQRHKLQENLPEREMPEFGDVYRDIFGNRYAVLNVVESWGTQGNNKPFVALQNIGKGDLYTPTLEDFMNPKFVKE